MGVWRTSVSDAPSETNVRLNVLGTGIVRNLGLDVARVDTGVLGDLFNRFQGTICESIRCDIVRAVFVDLFNWFREPFANRHVAILFGKFLVPSSADSSRSSYHCNCK